MLKAFGSVVVAMSVMAGPAMAGSCIVPFIKTLDNQTVSGTMYAASGKRCSITVMRTPGPVFSARVVTQPSNGSVSINGNRVIYLSRPGYVGDDRFVYARQGLDAVNRPITRTVDVSVKVSSRL
ncbi:hypothetical protein JQ625_19075 [Bradyrhizobium diazoefficiens]|nr:Ig-like domain-containing protein [Bradyrhizobium diazoefficiens]MBR0776944.1 hypothetical protein [Bradyrhizobium diazoefficiens]